MNDCIEPLTCSHRAVSSSPPAAWPAWLAGIALAIGLAMPARAAEPCKVNSLELPVTMVGSRAVAKIGINGTQVQMTVDSGAFFSILTEATVAQLKLPVHPMPYGMKVMGLTGQVDAQIAKVKTLQLLDGEIPNVEFIVGGNEPGAGTMGLLGRNMLAVSDTEYDLAHGVIRFMFPHGDCDGKNMAYWAGQTPVSELPLRRDDSWAPSIRTLAKLNGRELKVLFDTGATSLVSLTAARKAGILDADMKPAGQVYGAGRGITESWIAAIPTFEIAGEKVQNNRLRVANFQMDDADMLLGIDFFLSHRIYVAKSQGRMYFTYNGGPVFALNGAAAASDPEAGAEEPQDAAGYARRGAARAARRDFAHALEDLDHACAMAPEVADYAVRRGLLHQAMKQPVLAGKDFDTALRLDPAQPEARWARATLRAGSGQREGSLDDLQALDKTLPSQAHLRLDMSRLFDKLDQPEKALAQLNLWIPVHRNEVGLDQALNARCWLRTMLGVELDAAYKDCDEAVDLQPKNAAYLDSRGWVQLRRGDYRNAIRDYDRALKIRPDVAWSLYGRGIARLRLDPADDGRADIVAARKLLPEIDDKAARFGLAADLLLPAKTQ